MERMTSIFIYRGPDAGLYFTHALGLGTDGAAFLESA
jgi:hypothetical protein